MKPKLYKVKSVLKISQEGSSLETDLSFTCSPLVADLIAISLADCQKKWVVWI